MRTPVKRDYLGAEPRAGANLTYQGRLTLVGQGTLNP